MKYHSRSLGREELALEVCCYLVKQGVPFFYEQKFTDKRMDDGRRRSFVEYIVTVNIEHREVLNFAVHANTATTPSVKNVARV
jgi:hypothetical protein